MSNPTATQRPAIQSSLAGDPAFAPLLDMFVNELPQRIAAIESAWEQAELDQVQTIAHQLKGAGGGYGYADVTDAARTLEASLKEGRAGDEVLELIHELGAVCDAVARGRI